MHTNGFAVKTVDLHLGQCIKTRYDCPFFSSSSSSLVYIVAENSLKPYLGQVEDSVHVDGDGDEWLVLVDACTAQPYQLHGSQSTWVIYI